MLFADKYSTEDYSNAFKIRLLSYTPTKGEGHTLEEQLASLCSSPSFQETVYSDKSIKITIRGYEKNANYILLAFSECDHNAKVPITPPAGSDDQDTASVNNLDIYQVFMLVEKNAIYANIQISSRKLHSVINGFLRKIGILGTVRESLNIDSVEIIKNEGIRGFEINSLFSQEDTINLNTPKSKVRRFFKDLFNEEPPIISSPLMGRFTMNLSDNMSYVSDDNLIDSPEEIIEYLGQEISLITGKGKKISGQSFVQESIFYLRPYARNSVSKVAAFATLSYYWTQI